MNISEAVYALCNRTHNPVCVIDGMQTSVNELIDSCNPLTVGALYSGVSPSRVT